MQPTAEPEQSASRHSLVPASARASGPLERAERDDGREERRGHQPAAQLLAQHGDLDQAQPEPTLVVGLLDGEPPLLGHGVPDGGVVATRGIRRSVLSWLRPRAGQGSDDGARSHPRPQRVVPRSAVEQRRRRLAQSLLIGRKVEVHGGAVYGHH